jgi:YD repeat-containing protein
VIQAVRPASGVHVAGPPMLRPSEIDAVVKAAARQRTAAHSVVLPAVGSVRRPNASGAAAQPATRRIESLPSDQTASGTGINPWWRYQEQGVPGGGRAMVNVGTGNVLLQDDDMTVPHKGITMAFRRTYNSQSGHNVNASDAVGLAWEPAGMYGNGWTNTFDAHMARNSTSTVFTVFDIDGARYDYDSPVPLTYYPRAGNHATLTFDGDCGFLWTKKNGTTYYFYRPVSTAPCIHTGSTTGGIAGRLHQIIGRNTNTYITFSYSWDNGDASATGKINSITAQTESGLTTTLSFADVNGHRLLQQLTYPDGATSVSYGYDANGNLTSVSHPPNNASGVRPVQTFGYQSIGSDWVLSWAASPRFSAGCNSSCGSDGGWLSFGISGSGAVASTVTSIAHVAVVNPTIPDGTNSGPIQGAGYSTSATQYLTEYFTTGVTTPTFRDTDGHMANWVVDGTGRPTQTQSCATSTNQGQQCTGTWLVTNETWDANNNLTAQIDVRGNETDSAYDANGNVIATAAPQVSTTEGTFRPTTLFSYDSNNNIVSGCDPRFSHNNGLDWVTTPAPSDTLCPSTTGATRMAWVSTSTEPFGELQTLTTPLGYGISLQYRAGLQGGLDYGLPTASTGTQFLQSDGSAMTAQKAITYDANGNVTSLNMGSGAWNIIYDQLGRVQSSTDPDGVSSYSYYFANGAVSAVESAYQHSLGGTSQTPGPAAVTFSYDVDGNKISESRHHGCSTVETCNAGVTSNWYDGEDRLVETLLPQDPNDLFACIPFATRYMYDLSQGGLSSIFGSNGYYSHGGIFKTQRYMPQVLVASSLAGYCGDSPPATMGWVDVGGTASDALDRKTTELSYWPGKTAIVTASTTYDTPSLGLVGSRTNGRGDVTSYSYDSSSRPTDVNFAQGHCDPLPPWNDCSTLPASYLPPARHLTYDADGHVAIIATSAFGSQTYIYDNDGRLASSGEPAGGSGVSWLSGSGNLSSPATMTYSYYPNGWKSGLSVNSSATASQPIQIGYIYRADGKTSKITSSFAGVFAFGLSAAGRRTSQSDFWNNRTFSYDNFGRETFDSVSASLFDFTYDLDDGLLGYQMADSQAYDRVTYSYNIRGELSSEFNSANGFAYPTNQEVCGIDLT